MLIVVAIGGNALLKRGEPLEADIQKQNITTAAKYLAEIALLHDLVIVHGNGPQVGLLALMAENYNAVKPYPLDILNAETQGMIGYLLQQEMINYLHGKKEIATLLTQVVVDKDDPAFAHPTKPIGPIYTEEQSKQLSFPVAKDGNYYRRVVPSPKPIEIIELNVITQLIQKNSIPICAGGGGIPVIKHNNKIIGIEAVIDKDMSAALLATSLNADGLIILTDVKHVEINYGKPDAKAIQHMTPTELSHYVFPAGSMGPKITAACEFVQKTKRWARIGALDDARNVLNGHSGTFIHL